MLHFFGLHYPNEVTKELFYLSGDTYKEIYEQLVVAIETQYLDQGYTEQECKDFIFETHPKSVIAIYLISPGIPGIYVLPYDEDN